MAKSSPFSETKSDDLTMITFDIFEMKKRRTCTINKKIGANYIERKKMETNVQNGVAEILENRFLPKVFEVISID